MKLSALIHAAGLSSGPADTLLTAAPLIDAAAGSDPEILRISDDSREGRAGTLFVATAQARPYLSRVLADAAVAAVLLPAELRGDPVLSAARSGRPVARDVRNEPVLLFAADLLAAQGALAAALRAFPSHDLRVIGVTGTNGKTTVTRMLYEIWRGLGRAAGVIGTLGVRWEGRRGPVESWTGYTTPRAPQLQSILSDMRDDGVEFVALEVSSEALELGRLAGTRFAGAAFTNLSVDHLDFHGDMESYYLAKRRLFEHCARAGGRLWIATETEHGRRLARDFASCPGLALLSAPFVTELPAPTRFNRWNASLACLVAETLLADEHAADPAAGAGSAQAQQAWRERILALLREHAGIPGRFYRVIPPLVDAGAPELYGIVDYAHTPDALENLLSETRALGVRTLVCVFGCGGDRDRGKRPLMGAIAARLADVAIVCDDNPRTEDPTEIRRQILAGMTAQSDAPERVGSPAAPDSRSAREVGDRREAIRVAVELARAALKPAAVVVAGKGHEEYQIFADRRLRFSDREELEACFAQELPLK